MFCVLFVDFYVRFSCDANIPNKTIPEVDEGESATFTWAELCRPAISKSVHNFHCPGAEKARTHASKHTYARAHISSTSSSASLFVRQAVNTPIQMITYFPSTHTGKRLLPNRSSSLPLPHCTQSGGAQGKHCPQPLCCAGV